MCCERCKLYNSLNVFSEELKICHVKRLHDGKKKTEYEYALHK